LDEIYLKAAADSSRWDSELWTEFVGEPDGCLEKSPSQFRRECRATNARPSARENFRALSLSRRDSYIVAQ
jgi:hypothetical protein